MGGELLWRRKRRRLGRSSWTWAKIQENLGIECLGLEGYGLHL
jgi:hypothetical protein